MRVLVVEDDEKLAGALRDGLESEGYDVVVEETGEGAFFRTTTEVFDTILLDLELPGRHGLEVLSLLRRRSIRTPVMIVTARGGLGDRVRGLEDGADDYLIKPFAFSELLARIRALCRRSRASPPQISVDSVLLDRVERRVTRDGVRVDLTVKEFDVLECLMRREGEVVSRKSLAREVWKDWTRSTTLNNVIDVHILRLRRKIETDPSSPRFIQTIRGVGFMIGRERSTPGG